MAYWWDELPTRPPIGTIYLHEPACLPRDLQDRLTQWLAQPDADRPRVLAGSSTVPSQDVRSGRLLEELHCTLATLVFELDRCTIACWNCPGLSRSSVQRLGAKAPAGGLTVDAWAALQAHHWPGNLRELAAILARALEHSGGKTIDVGHLPVLRLEPTAIPSDERVLSLDRLLEQVERRLIIQALRRASWQQEPGRRTVVHLAARLLRRMEALGIQEPGGLGEQVAELQE